MATTTNFGWETPDDTDLVKDGALAMRTLGNAIDTSLVDLKGGTTGQVLSKTSNTDMDFTWVTSDDANAIQNAIVDAKGDLITATAADTPARLAVGNNGEQLLADSSATAGLRWTATPSANNPIINGGFDIWQRGTSFANPTSNAYVADRFQQSVPTNTTITRQATADTTNLPSIQYCIRVARNNGATTTGTLYLGQANEIENCVPFAGKTVTFSFYARKGANYSATSDILNLRFFTGTSATQQNAFTGAYTGSVTAINENYTLTTTWQRFTKTITLNADITQFSYWFQHTTTGTAGAADYYELTGVQVDIGSVALPFRRTSSTLQGELAACQRYYQRFTEDVAYTALLLGMANATTTCVLSAPLLVAMRTSPTFAAANVYLYSLNNIKTVSSYTNRSSKTNVSVIANTSGLTGGEANRLEGQGSSNGYVEMSAEL